MMLSGVVPWEGLPAWMYHGQEPPPSHDFNPHHAGITWVDLVFPFFLFSMGAAIPLAQGNRETPVWRTVLRGLMLVAFAIFNQHFRPYELAAEPGPTVWGIALLGFFLALGMFGRFPAAWPKSVTYVARIVGWGGAIWVGSHLTYPSGTMPGFAKERSDIIILVLAFVSVVGTLVWRATRESIEARLAIIAALFAFRLSASVDGSFAEVIWTWTHVGWLFQPEFAGYLLLVLPGTIVGDLLRRQAPSPPRPELAVGGLMVVLAALVVFFTRSNPMWIVLVAAAPVAWLEWRQTPSPILRWSFLWLVLGCLLEPFEGGIKKDPFTFSYLFATAGLAGYTLVALAELPRRGLTVVGQNPLLAYQAVTNLVPALWAFAIAPFLGDWAAGPVVGMGLALSKTALLAGVVALFTRFGVSMRV